MTEFWVSQGNKWCDFCKIYLSNNPATIRNHELGQRHKDNVAKRLNDMRKDKAAKEKELKEAARAIQQIESKAQRSYQKDVASQKEARESHDIDSQMGNGDEKWEYDSSSGYYRSEDTGLLYDSNSGFYYSDTLGKWVTQEEAYKSVQLSKKPKSAQPSGKATPATEKKGLAFGPVVSGPLNKVKTAKGAAPSSFAVKRKRPEEKKRKVVSKEEEAALKAREAAKKRMEEREKPLLGLYNGNWKS
ncbi:hypothetical protein MLD38_035343 [Melastoma candidum]|uniref:Uncharacterized protein n=1 Tax=Melastoma candidum TaxID=119954 RepID=A0ACB9LG05_9MYRT|nr:hypothetical protein MLD38_035343 [Melastoma candidum]